MSVGGKVTEVIKLKEKVYIDTDDGSENCAIYVKLDDNSKNVIVSDIVWWQGKKAYWTTENESEVETVLHRLGFSGVSRPI